MSTQLILNENDFESPGYEFLRSYHCMNNLYYKLIALNYQKEFRLLYKCPPINKYYFSVADKNPSEQQFLFTCLCSWLIKDKCQMNLELEPDEYNDFDSIVGIILEALRLLLTSDEEYKAKKDPITFPPGRLKQGYGPEVIWTMNILADRALEMMLESDKNPHKTTVTYHNKNQSDQNRLTSGNSITIGQPLVGGGLTTRPLGSYQVDDTSLLFDDDCEPRNNGDDNVALDNSITLSTDQWYEQTNKVSEALESAYLDGGDEYRHIDWSRYLQETRESKKSIQDFMNQSKSTLNAIMNRIDRQMQIISEKETFIQTNLKTQLEDFLEIWRNYSSQLAENDSLMKQVNSKTDLFEGLDARLKLVGLEIESRIRELNDGSKLKELKSLIDNLNLENSDLRIKIGLLLTVYSKKESKIIAGTGES